MNLGPKTSTQNVNDIFCYKEIKFKSSCDEKLLGVIDKDFNFNNHVKAMCKCTMKLQYIDVYKYFNRLSPPIMQEFFETRTLNYNLRNFGAIDLFMDSDAILITSLFAMHCGISTVYKMKTKIIGQPEV